MNPELGEITQLLANMKLGNADAEARLISLLYRDLRRVAGSHMRNERADHSLQPTALVHEAYLRLRKVHSIDWQSRSHFLAVAAHTMRQILVDHARAKHAGKRGLDWNQVSIEVGELSAAPESTVDIVVLDEALGRLVRRPSAVARRPALHARHAEAERRLIRLRRRHDGARDCRGPFWLSARLSRGPDCGDDRSPCRAAGAGFSRAASASWRG